LVDGCPRWKSLATFAYGGQGPSRAVEQMMTMICSTRGSARCCKKNLVQPNVEVHWNNIQNCVFRYYELFVWESQEEIKKAMDYTGNDQSRGRMLTMKEVRKNFIRLRNELKRATEKAKEEYQELICDTMIEFQRTECYDLM
jgi:hypothetical protein